MSLVVERLAYDNSQSAVGSSQSAVRSLQFVMSYAKHKKECQAMVKLG